MSEEKQDIEETEEERIDVTRRFPAQGDLRRFGITEIRSFTLRQITLKDELAAVARVDGEGSKAYMGNAAVAHCIAEAIVAIDDKPVQPPFLAWMDYQMRTVNAIRTAYQNWVEGGDDENYEDFFEAEFGTKKSAPKAGA